MDENEDFRRREFKRRLRMMYGAGSRWIRLWRHVLYAQSSRLNSQISHVLQSVGRSDGSIQRPSELTQRSIPFAAFMNSARKLIKASELIEHLESKEEN